MAEEIDPKTGFEDALKRVEQIVEQMERGELGLDELVARFEEGQRLVQFCSGKLNEVEQRIEKLVKKPDGTIGAEAFGAETAGTAAAE